MHQGRLISGNSGSPYAEGALVNVTAQPAPGWQFLRWQVDASGSTPGLAITMDRAKNVQAVFGTSMIQNGVGPGTIALDPAQGPYPYGSTVRITATPNAGASFAAWGNAASGAEDPLAFVVTTANPAVCAMFVSGENTAPPTADHHGTAGKPVGCSGW